MIKKEWIDMSDEEKNKDDLKTYLVEFILDCKRLLADMPEDEWLEYEKGFNKLKKFIEQ